MSLLKTNSGYIDDNLYSLISRLYYSAYWQSDRLTSEQEKELWEAVKDSFGFIEPSPKRVSKEKVS